MPINKVVYGNEVLIDLTQDTIEPQYVAKGYTAHAANGEAIVGTMENSGGSDDEIDRILTYGLADGWKNYSSDGTIIESTDSKGRYLRKVFSDDFNSCTITLTSATGTVLGEVIKTYDHDNNTMISRNSKGEILIKTFGDGLSKVSSVLSDSNGNVIATQEKVYTNEGQTIESTVVRR